MINAERKFLETILRTAPIAVKHMVYITSDPEYDDLDFYVLSIFGHEDIDITKEEFDDLVILIRDFRRGKKTHETKM